MKKIGKLKIHPSREIEKSFVSIGFECLDRDMFKGERCIEPLLETGAKHARVQTGWAKCEKEPGVYDFAWLDATVEPLIAGGINVWFNVGFGNPLYMHDAPPHNDTCVGCVPILYGDEVVRAWENYVEALCRHYAGKVTMFEIWNEANHPPFWYPGTPDPIEYAAFYRLTAKVIKRIIPDAVCGGCITWTAYGTYTGILNGEYYHRFMDELKPDEIDFLSYHYYGRIPEAKRNIMLKLLRENLDERGFSNVKLIQGEAGYPSWAYVGHSCIKEGTDSERAQAVWQLRRYFNDAKMGIDMSSFFQIADMWERPYRTATQNIPKCAGHGILRGLTYEKKESYRTFSIIANLMRDDFAVTDGDFTVEADGVKEAAERCEFTKGMSADAISGDAIERLTLTRHGFKLYSFHALLKVSEPAEFDVKITLPEPLTDPVLLDCYTGEIFEEPDLDHMTLREYPQILCERSALEIE